MEQIETVIIGGGQAGLATSYWLTQLGREHTVLEQAAETINAWRNERWDSFCLVTPNWTLCMPGAEYDGPDRHGFLPRDEIVAYFDRYVERFRLPIRTNTRVLSVEEADRGYVVRTEKDMLLTRHVVIATGYEQQPKIPSFAVDLPPGITQLHTSRYRKPAALPPGAVLVVGSGQSGCQIAEELYQHGRRVFLATGGSSGRSPRRYRGKDIVDWLFRVGFFDRPLDQFPVPRTQLAAPHVSGAKGGHVLNLHLFARDGVSLLGHLRGVVNGKLRLAPDLLEHLTRIDEFERRSLHMIDDFIKAQRLVAPTEEIPQLRDGFAQPVIEELDLATAGIATVIWATGFAADYGLVRLPVRDTDGFPIQMRGVTNFPGLYFVGMPWMPSLRSGNLAGVGEFAEHIAAKIAAGGSRPARQQVTAVPA